MLPMTDGAARNRRPGERTHLPSGGRLIGLRQGRFDRASAAAVASEVSEVGFVERLRVSEGELLVA
jgi:hypothetical protein